MSSNYRIFLHFLTTLDDAINVATGLRGNPHLMNRIRQSLNEQSKINVSKLKKFQQSSSSSEFRKLKVSVSHSFILFFFIRLKFIFRLIRIP